MNEQLERDKFTSKVTLMAIAGIMLFVLILALIFRCDDSSKVDVLLSRILYLEKESIDQRSQNKKLLAITLLTKKQVCFKNYENELYRLNIDKKSNKLFKLKSGFNNENKPVNFWLNSDLELSSFYKIDTRLVDCPK